MQFEILAPAMQHTVPVDMGIDLSQLKRNKKREHMPP